MPCNRKRVYVKKRKDLPGLPWLPVVREEPDIPSVYITNAYAGCPYPPLMLRKSWTRSVPHKESFEYTKPSDSIGCSYSPQAARMNIHLLPPQKKEPLECPIPASGELGYPSKEWYQMLDKIDENLKKSKVQEEKPSVVSLQDLCSGDYFRKADGQMAKRRKVEKPKETLSQFLAKVDIAITEERMYGLM
ncbi:hypothetical protein RUM44_011245 [Polyplax serrata]|uniref:Uncharacterized protein n=1 Tax=Polyplax serrata TaxID=468196 RepID=A0ABR1APG9_POLSC